MKKGYFLYTLTYLAFSLLFVPHAYSNASPNSYEELIDLVSKNPSPENLRFFDRALRTPNNEFKLRYPLSLGTLNEENAGASFLSFTGPKKDLRAEAAGKILLSGIFPATEFYQQYKIHGKTLAEYPRGMTNLSDALLAFTYFDAYNPTQGISQRDQQLEKAVSNRLKENNERAKVEIIDPLRARLLSNCENAYGDISLSLVSLSALATKKDDSLDLVTHNFFYPQQKKMAKAGDWIRSKVGLKQAESPSEECKKQQSEIEKKILSAKMSGNLLILKANGNKMELTEIKRFHTDAFISTCREDFLKEWVDIQSRETADITQSAENGKVAIENAVNNCQSETQAELRRIENEQVRVSQARNQRINEVNLHSSDNTDWGRRYAGVIKDPSLRYPQKPDLFPELVLETKDPDLYRRETAEEKEARIAIEKENAELGALVRKERQEKELLEAKQKTDEENAYLAEKAKWQEAWLKGYQEIISGRSPYSFERAMKQLMVQRERAESAFLAGNPHMKQVKSRIESRIPASGPIYFPTRSTTPPAPPSPELAKEISIRKQAEIVANQTRMKHHQDFISGHFSYGIPSNLDEFQAYGWVMSKLSEIETKAYNDEYNRLRGANK